VAAATIGFAMVGLAVLGVSAPAHAARSLTDCQPAGTSGAYPPASASIGLTRTVLTAGSSDTVFATGFAKAGQPGAGGTVQLTFCSTPTSIGTATIAADGTISQAVSIPTDAVDGQHVIQAVGPNGEGGTTIVSTDLTVVSPVTNTSSSLPFTGFDIVPVVLSGVLLIVVGGSLVLVTRRRMRQSVG
jgi:hypothetical protein